MSDIQRPLRVALVAGETSGDTLGAGLIREIRRRVPEVEFEGICGPEMRAEGARSLFPMDSISIMGLDGLFGSLYKILNIRSQLYRKFVLEKPDVFVGIDVPDFNLGLEVRLKKAGIRTVHYVSPTVWAWRQYRIRKIRHAVDRMLTLFPFEAHYYEQHGVPVTCVGHPVADQIDLPAIGVARQRLSLPLNAPIVALLPGSRHSEVSRLAPIFAETATRLLARHPEVHFVVPCAGQAIRGELDRSLGSVIPENSVTRIDGNARLAMRASDVVLLASGTAALEAALVATPMVVAYRVSLASSLMVKAFSTVEHYSMPNHLLPEPIVPEYLQDEARPENLLRAVEKYLLDESANAAMRRSLGGILESLKMNADAASARAVLQVADELR